MVHRREIDGREVVLGNQGDLYGNAMTWWDHATGSVWSQPLGEAILGEIAGTKLELMASTLTQWGAWLSSHPQTLAIDTFGFPMVVGLDDVAIVVELGDQAVAYDYGALSRVGVVNDIVSNVEIAVVVDPVDDQRWAVFSRRLDDQIVELEIRDTKLIDVLTGTEFDPVRGFGVAGPLEGQTLDLLPGSTVFQEDFATFWPEGRSWPSRG